MAGGNPKNLSKKPSSSSYAERKSRWESNAAHNAPPSGAKSSTAAGGAESKPTTKASTNPNSQKPTPKRNIPNPSSGGHQKPQSDPSAPPSGPPFSLSEPPIGPPPTASYGFHMLDRRTMVLADGSVRSYWALPPDYQDFLPPRPPMGRFMPHGGPELGGPGRFPPIGPMSPGGFRDREDQFGRGPNQDYWNSLGLDARRGPEGPLKRKYGEEDDREGGGRDEFARQRQQLLQYGNAGASVGERGGFLPGTSSAYPREDEFRSSKFMKTNEGFDNMGVRDFVDPTALKKAFLNFAKVINENANQKKNYLDNGKHGKLQCIVCGRSSKDFSDMHGLIMHTYHPDNADLRVDHLGLHKALCVLMGWNYMKTPDNSRAYQFLPADKAAENQDDLIMWPPMVIIHNTSTGKGKDGRIEGLGNKAMDSKIRDLGFGGGKSKSLYSRDGHLGITLIKFAADQSGLREAIRLTEHFEKDNHGRRDWAHLQSMLSGRHDENNPFLVKVDERTGEKKRIFYGYLATGCDLDKVDIETRKKVVLESKQEYLRFK